MGPESIASRIDHTLVESEPRMPYSRRLVVLLTLVFLPVEPMMAQEQQPDRKALAGREWAKPSELRSKKLIDAGIYTMDSKMNSHWLADHPEFTTKHPFDGLVVRLPLKAGWCKTHDLPPDTHFDDLAWSTKSVSYEAVQDAIADLKRTKWGQLTDNFLWWNLRGGVEKLRGDLENDDDWKALEHNARLAARICKEANLKGLLFDTEQYGVFPGTKFHYPFGKAKADLLRKRGRAWMNAVQQECPDLVILFTFAWAPDLDAAGFLAGVKEFLNGMLDASDGKTRLVHGYENTFYYGQVAGSRFTKDGFRGDRARYEEAVASMRKWSSYANNPKKFEKHVRVGMAAWVESDPWNLWNGWPSGTKDTIWSNVPLALATSDEYVWCWSEHTNYLHTLTNPVPGQTGLNPYLASLTNQTFNTSKERVTRFDEDFATNPLAKGWYFDFDMLEVGRKRKPQDAGWIMPSDAVPYHWLPDTKVLHVENAWTRRTDQQSVARHDRQRRRFVHPIHETRDTDTVKAEFEFVIQDFGDDAANLMMLGLFRSDVAANRSSVTLRVSRPNTASIVIAGEHGAWESKPIMGLKANQKYQFQITMIGASKSVEVRLLDSSTNMSLGEIRGAMPKEVMGLLFDEIGIAQPDWMATETPKNKAHAYRVTRIRFERE